MTNQSKYDFSINTRQSKVAILLIIYKFYKAIVRGILPIIAIFLFGSGGNKSVYIYTSLIVISIIVFTMSILSYYRFYFRIENEELYIEKGVFKKVKLNIPFERIQTVNFEQNLVLQLFDKYKVEVDTAGSAQKEFSFDALDKNIAEELRSYILDRKQESQIELTDEKKLIEEKESSTNDHIYTLSFTDLIKVGLTENHLKAGGWLLAVIAYFYSLFNDIGYQVEDEIEEGVKTVLDTFIETKVLIIGIIAIPSLFILISVVRTCMKYYQLKFDRIKNGFKIYSGLLNRKEYSAPDSKIQKVAWGDNPLRRIFGIFVIYFKQARSMDGERNKSISIPILSKMKISRVLRYLYGGDVDKKMHRFDVSRHFFIRGFLYFILIPSVIGGFLGYYLENMWMLAGVVIYFIYFTISRYIQWNKAAYFINDLFIQRKKGIYGNYFELIPWYKIQSIELNQTIYQRRYNLANVHLHTAAGTTTIPYIPLGQAQKIRDYGLYIAETDSREWM